jgi:hypothetical protein
VLYFPIFRVPECSELSIRTDSRSRCNQERGVAELGIFLLAHLAAAIIKSIETTHLCVLRRVFQSGTDAGTLAPAHFQARGFMPTTRCRPFSPRF